MPATPRLRRVRDFLVATLERPLLFAFWAFVLWGTLLIAVFGVRVASAGLKDAVVSLLPPGADGLAYGNLVAIVVATLVWLTVATLALVNRRARVAAPKGDQPPLTDEQVRATLEETRR